MDELIKEILYIEEKAQEIVSGAREARNDLAARVSRDARKMRDDIERQTLEKSNTIEKSETAEAEKQLDAISAAAKNAMQSLEEKYEQNKNAWVSSIVEGIIGG